MKLLKALAGIGLTFLFMTVLSVGVALAHTGSPGMVTFSNGQILTSADLNNALAHIHNTLSGGIVDSNISSSAAISHSKMATPSLLPKAWAYVSAACNGSTAAGTATCTTVGSQVTAIYSSGTNGQFCVKLGYTPTNANFAAEVTSHTPAVVCVADSQSTGVACGAITRHLLVKCFDYAGAATVASAQFSVAVLDDD